MKAVILLAQPLSGIAEQPDIVASQYAIINRCRCGDLKMVAENNC